MATHKVKVLCKKCGGYRFEEQPTVAAKPQPSAAVLAGALVPDPPDMIATLRAARPAPAQRQPILAQPALPTETSITALGASETVPSPSLVDQQASLIAYRASLAKGRK